MNTSGLGSKERIQVSGEVKTVQRALDLMKMIGTSESPLGVNEIARRLGKHASSISRSLATLEHNGFVERNQETGKFVLGPELIVLAGRLLAVQDVIRVARTYLDELAHSTKATASLALWNRTEAITVEYVPGPGAIKHVAAPGERNPAHCTATGKAILSQMDGSDVRKVLGVGLKQYTDRTITDLGALERELLIIREQGYAVNLGEFDPEIVSIAAAIHDRRGRPTAAISVTMPAFHFDREAERDFAPLVKEAAASISRRLGYDGDLYGHP